MKYKILKFSLFTSALLTSGAAMAHSGATTGNGLLSGILHPLTGADHLLVLIAIGIWGSLLSNSKTAIQIGATFIAALILGTFLGTQAITLPILEPTIAATVVIAGLLISFKTRLPTTAALLLATSFALFHGNAHGLEMPAASGALPYFLGLISASTLLLATSHWLGKKIIHHNWLLRAVGIGTGAMGTAILLGV